MAKFMFVVPPFFGHISPTLSVGGSLLARGHEVVWVGITELADAYIPEGGRFIVPHEELAPYKDAIARILKRQDDGAVLSGPEVLKLALEETYIPFALYMQEGLLRIIDSYQPDVIVNDCITFAGGLCAYKRGIPYVTTTPVPPDVMGNTTDAPKIFEWQQRLVRNLQQEYGIYTDEFVIHSNELNLVFTSQEFSRITDAPPHMQFVGPVQGRPNHTFFDFDALHKISTPKVFVSLGTLLVDIRKAFFEKIVAAFKDEPVTIIAATDPGILEEWPDNFIVQSYVPQTQLLPYVDAVICHGGFNTVNDALLNELPLLITPITYDHFHTASLIERGGCGVKLRYKRLRIEELKAAVWALLQNPVYKQGAGRIKQSFIDAGGNDKAVDCLERFVATAKSVTAVY
ncbi:glycosyltransferase, MGT family [Filimonas lacunae]|uniref:Glycosyltransferase, MGT family n=1 Tax=Filimonas lacunae TaxID=477680 RepID=A0A173M998_9BACT|nr:nucleotide disphospho-sugar-binding domain-containing protein [Filimonas lacunae]BAV04115.1 zeaxanthin glucosyl transferase [Filimonas lacunae]SIT15311.1 glycosyltransferase, MGT family [Filimonas lacunae]